MKRLVYIVSLLVLLVGCSSIPPEPEKMVLEGWIDADGYPTVLIHKSYILANAPDTVKSLEEIVGDMLIPFGYVSISDGTKTVVLTGRLDTLYLPPYTYTSLDIEGQVGRTYTVTATYRSLKATASTTIPPKARLDSLSIATQPSGIMSVHGYLSHLDPGEESYYCLFLRKKGNKQYMLCPFGVFSSKDAQDGRLDMLVYNPLSDTTTIDAGTTYFAKGDSSDYQLKVARVDYPSYRFWKAYNDQIITQGMMFVSVFKNIPSNINGGMGYFSGMGSTVYPFHLRKDTVCRYPL